MHRIAIYGAGKYGKIVRTIYEKRGYTIACFLVSHLQEPSKTIDGTKIIAVNKIDEIDLGVSEIIVAMDEKNWGDVRKKISEYLQNYDTDKIVFLKKKDIRKLVRETFPVEIDSIFHSTEPVSRDFGLDRGTAIDRYYIEKFLSKESKFIKEPYITLEVGEDIYSKKYFPYARHDILDYSLGMDLTKPESLPSEMYDVFICTQTFHQIYDLNKAIYGAWKLLRYGGTMLATVCGCVTQLARTEEWDHYWGFTVTSFRRLLEEQFGNDVVVVGYGNSMVATAFIQGLAFEEIDKTLLDINDNDFSICISAVARKG